MTETCLPVNRSALHDPDVAWAFVQVVRQEEGWLVQILARPAPISELEETIVDRKGKVLRECQEGHLMTPGLVLLQALLDELGYRCVQGLPDVS